jgi:hypothetical protein
MKVHLNETYSKVGVGKLLSGTFPIQKQVENIDALGNKCSSAIALQFCLRICHQESSRKSSQFEIEWDTSAIGLCCQY